DRVALPVPPGSLVEYLAVHLLLDRLALAHAAREALGYTGPLRELRGELRGRIAPQPAPTPDERAFPVFQLAQVLGWSPDELARLSPAQWGALLAEIETFDDVQRRRVFHLAYEHRFRTQSLDAIAARAALPPEGPAQPRFQVVTCLDEREESF